MFTRRSLVRGSAGFLLGSTLLKPAASFAQFDGKTGRIIVGFAAGGGTDVLARLLAQQLKTSQVSNFVVDNRPGAAARIAVDVVKNSEPDGRTLLFTPDFPITLYPYSFRNLNYDPLKDFKPVAPAAKYALVLCVGPAVPAEIKKLADFVAWCKANTDKALYATTAAGGTPHFAGLLLSQEAGVRMTPVSYKGGAPALQDLVGGHVQSSINPVGEVLPFVKAGTVRALAVFSAQRSEFLPDVPTMRESGYNVAFDGWAGVLVPAKTPDALVATLNAAVRDAFGSADTKEKLATLGFEPFNQTAGEFAATIDADQKRWEPVVKASGFVAD